ncbi:MAG: glycoside hydrolase family 16 protein [Bacteroidetes bacterium]|nr:MAG: glycoside hydrolase family 16 protein [Bacteroidota bacterium]
MYCHALPPHASTLLLFALLASNTLWAQLPAKSQNGYKLVWQDEFNHTGQPDTTKWRFENGFKRNQEAQWYQAENAHCAGGYLVITAKKEEKPNPNYKPDSKNWTTRDALITYTSASVVMHKAHAFKFGKLEVRAKLDAQTGLWPAIWTLGVDGEWPSNGEVDLMEYYNGGILANIAIADTGRHRAIWDGAFRHLDSLGGKAWADAFHIWTLEWDTDYMRIFVDGQLLNEIDLQHSINKTDGKNPFRQPHYVLLNLAMGGTKGGSLQNTSLPSQYLIDYVRIYQKKR